MSTPIKERSPFKRFPPRPSSTQSHLTCHRSHRVSKSPQFDQGIPLENSDSFSHYEPSTRSSFSPSPDSKTLESMALSWNSKDVDSLDFEQVNYSLFITIFLH